MDLGFHEIFTGMIRDTKKKNEHTDSIASPTDPLNSIFCKCCTIWIKEQLELLLLCADMFLFYFFYV